jgi:hypothetical protein
MGRLEIQSWRKSFWYLQDWSLEQMMCTLGGLPHFCSTLSFHLWFQFSSHFCNQLLWTSISDADMVCFASGVLLCKVAREVFCGDKRSVLWWFCWGTTPWVLGFQCSHESWSSLAVPVIYARVRLLDNTDDQGWLCDPVMGIGVVSHFLTQSLWHYIS